MDKVEKYLQHREKRYNERLIADIQEDEITQDILVRFYKNRIEALREKIEKHRELFFPCILGDTEKELFYFSDLVIWDILYDTKKKAEKLLANILKNGNIQESDL